MKLDSDSLESAARNLNPLDEQPPENALLAAEYMAKLEKAKDAIILFERAKEGVAEQTNALLDRLGMSEYASIPSPLTFIHTDDDGLPEGPKGNIYRDLFRDGKYENRGSAFAVSQTDENGEIGESLDIICVPVTPMINRGPSAQLTLCTRKLETTYLEVTSLGEVSGGVKMKVLIGPKTHQVNTVFMFNPKTDEFKSFNKPDELEEGLKKFKELTNVEIRPEDEIDLEKTFKATTDAYQDRKDKPVIVKL